MKDSDSWLRLLRICAEPTVATVIPLYTGGAGLVELWMDSGGDGALADIMDGRRMGGLVRLCTPLTNERASAVSRWAGVAALMRVRPGEICNIHTCARHVPPRDVTLEAKPSLLWPNNDDLNTVPNEVPTETLVPKQAPSQPPPESHLQLLLQLKHLRPQCCLAGPDFYNVPRVTAICRQHVHERLAERRGTYRASGPAGV